MYQSTQNACIMLYAFILLLSCHSISGSHEGFGAGLGSVGGCKRCTWTTKVSYKIMFVILPTLTFSTFFLKFHILVQVHWNSLFPVNGG